MAKRREYKITNAINRVGDEVNSILNKRRSTRYFEAIVVIYSLVENVLKWLVYLKIVWDKCDRVLPDDELNALRQFCNQQDFYSAQNLRAGHRVDRRKAFQTNRQGSKGTQRHSPSVLSVHTQEESSHPSCKT